jgi:plasmid stability protein
MAQVVIRNIDDDVVERLKARAAAEKKSLEQKLRDVLTEAARPSRAEVLAEVDRIRAMTPPRPPGAPLAEDLIREDRNSR